MSEIWPGDIVKGASGAEYVIGRAIGMAPSPDEVCDAPTATVYIDGRCRCVVCPRCGHHTGNSHQGHFWKMCKVLSARLRDCLPPGETLSAAELMKRTSREEFHFCCPGDCELDPGHAEGPPPG